MGIDEITESECDFLAGLGVANPYRLVGREVATGTVVGGREVAWGLATRDTICQCARVFFAYEREQLGLALPHGDAVGHQGGVGAVPGVVAA